MAKVIEKVGQAEAEKEELISGSEAIAVACKLADVDVITAYPIRPYDTVMQYVAKLVSNGEMDCEYIVAESEHSQFEIVKHASAGAAHPHGGDGRQPGARRPRGLRCGAQRRPRRARPGLDARLGGQRPGGAGCRANRLPRGRGPAGLPPLRHRLRRRLPHALPVDPEGPAPVPGQPGPPA